MANFEGLWTGRFMDIHMLIYLPLAPMGQKTGVSPVSDPKNGQNVFSVLLNTQLSEPKIFKNFGWFQTASWLDGFLGDY